MDPSLRWGDGPRMTGFLQHKLGLVTGASRGIGAALAEALAREGAHVILTARTADALEAVEDRIHDAGGSATIAPLDLTAPDGVAKLAAAVAGRWQALDLLVLNAAMLGTLTPVAQIDGKEFNRLLTLNLLAQRCWSPPSTRCSARAKGPADRHHLERRPQAPRLLGRLRRLQGRARNPSARLWRRGGQCQPDQGGDRQPRPYRHRDARPGLSRRGSGDAEDARRGGGGDRQAAAGRFRNRTPARPEKLVTAPFPGERN